MRARDSYLAARYHCLARRRGDKKVIAVVAHSILVAVWHILRHGMPYRDPGHDHFAFIFNQYMPGWSSWG